MRGLLSKLAGLDSDAARGLRVIEFFDQLLVHHADLDAVARATAVISEAVTGAVLDDTGEVVVVSPAGDVLATTGPSAHAVVHEVVDDDRIVGRVWLERPAPEHGREWDDLIVERMAQCLATLHARRGVTRRNAELGFTDPAILHVLIRDDESETDVARAARLLGFRVGETVRAIAVHADSAIDESLALIRTHVAVELRARSAAAPLSRTLAAMVVAVEDLNPFPVGHAAVCVGPPVRVERCHSSWAAARRGVRFPALGGRWSACTTSDEIGCVTVLADLDPAHVDRLPDVQAIGRLAAGTNGASDLRLLEGLGHFTSLRDMAEALHMHHSSVAYRCRTLSEALGYDVRSQDGRYRARTALTLWQLHVRVAAPD